MAANPVGRPQTEWTEALQTEIISRISSGESIRSIFQDDKFPARPTLYAKMARDEEFLTKIARAKKAGIMAQFDEFIDLADEADKDNYNAIKTRLWARTWAWSKIDPRTYGDKASDTNVNVNVGLQLVHSIPRPERKENAELQCDSAIESGARILDSPSE